MADSRIDLVGEWSAALHVLYPKHLAKLLLQMASGEVVAVSMVSKDADAAEVTLTADPALLMPLLRLEMARRQDKAAAQQGRGT